MRNNEIKKGSYAEAYLEEGFSPKDAWNLGRVMEILDEYDEHERVGKIQEEYSRCCEALKQSDDPRARRKIKDLLDDMYYEWSQWRGGY